MHMHGGFDKATILVVYWIDLMSRKWCRRPDATFAVGTILLFNLCCSARIDADSVEEIDKIIDVLVNMNIG